MVRLRFRLKNHARKADSAQKAHKRDKIKKTYSVKTVDYKNRNKNI